MPAPEDESWETTGEGGLSAVSMAFVEDTATLPSLPQLELFCLPAISMAKPKQQQGCGPGSQARARYSLHCKLQEVISWKDSVLIMTAGESHA